MMKSPRKFKQQGYLFVDHSNSPGLPENVARFAGYDPRLVREGRKFEADTLTCAHCKGVVIKHPERERPRGHCWACDKYVCDGCAYEMTLPDYIHAPWQKVVDDVKATE